MSTSISGVRKIPTSRIGLVEVREVPLLQFDDLARVMGNPENLPTAKLAVEQLRLFAQLTDEQINALTHAEIERICEAGLEVNGAFLSSFAGMQVRKIVELSGQVLAAQELRPSASGSTTAAPSPASIPTAPPVSASAASTP